MKVWSKDRWTVPRGRRGWWRNIKLLESEGFEYQLDKRGSRGVKAEIDLEVSSLVTPLMEIDIQYEKNWLWVFGFEGPEK